MLRAQAGPGQRRSARARPPRCPSQPRGARSWRRALVLACWKGILSAPTLTYGATRHASNWLAAPMSTPASSSDRQASVAVRGACSRPARGHFPLPCSHLQPSLMPLITRRSGVFTVVFQPPTHFLLPRRFHVRTCVLSRPIAAPRPGGSAPRHVSLTSSSSLTRTYLYEVDSLVFCTSLFCFETKPERNKKYIHRCMSYYDTKNTPLPQNKAQLCAIHNSHHCN